MLTNRQFRISLAILSALVVNQRADVHAGMAYQDPNGGWAYVYTGDQVDGADDAAALDETWNHNNGSDEWDGKALGDPDSSPGGIASITENGVTFARFDDTGDPRNAGFPDPGSNRKIYLTHDLGDYDLDGELLTKGATLSMRTRLATSGLLDSQVPVGGDGYYVRDDGKANFSIRSGGGAPAILSFALSTASGDDLASNATGSLLLNSYDPDGVGANVDTNEAGEHRELPLTDPTAWNEFWITIQAADASNQYQVNVYANGSTTPETFEVTGGSGSDGPFSSYLGMGVHSTAQHGAFDVDYFAFVPGLQLPTANNVGIKGDFNGDGSLDATDIDALTAEVRANTNAAKFDLTGDGKVDNDDRIDWIDVRKKTYIGDANLDGQFDSDDFIAVFIVGEYEDAGDGNSTWADGDWDGDGDFTSGDFVAAFVAGGYELGPKAAVANVPEPTSCVLTLGGVAVLYARRRRLSK